MIRAWLVAATLAIAVDVAHADDIIKGAVVKVDHQEIYVNFGDAQGVSDGAALRIKRTVRLRHPVTRGAIEDWVPVGSATVTQSGNRLSRAIVGELISAIKVGDVVEVLIESADVPAPTAPATPIQPTEPGAPAVEPATAAVLAAFTAQAGLSIDARIAAWEQYLSTHGSSPFASAIRQDIETLQGLREQMRPPAVAGEERVDAVEHNAPAEAELGTAIPVVFVVARPERVASAYLHYRARDQRTFARTLLVREHDIYLRGAVPAEVVRTPGVDYFVELSTPDGRSGLALGSPVDPVRVTVKPPPLVDRFGGGVGRSSVTIAGEYLSLATFDKRTGDRRDYIASATVDVGYRLDTIVQRIGVGYGAIAGGGGLEDQAWDDATPLPEAGFHYGYADLELGEQRGILGGKLIAGVGKTGFGMGVEVRGRIGRRDGTNLRLSALNLPEIGWATDVRFGTRPAGDLLIGISVGATDQPNRGDVAAKLATELEYIGWQHVSVLLRGSWQGRSTKHGGAGAGAALGFSW